MCTYSQLKKILNKFVQPPPMAPLMSQNCTRLAENYISKCIKGGSMKLATQVDYVYM